MRASCGGAPVGSASVAIPPWPRVIRQCDGDGEQLHAHAGSRFDFQAHSVLPAACTGHSGVSADDTSAVIPPKSLQRCLRTRLRAALKLPRLRLPALLSLLPVGFGAAAALRWLLLGFLLPRGSEPQRKARARARRTVSKLASAQACARARAEMHARCNGSE
jgi:hypothetical protein